MKLPLLIFALCTFLLCACESTQPVTSQGPDNTAMMPAPSQEKAEENPAAPGFNAALSDPKAIAIADEVMRAMGGRQAWDQTRYLAWNFFGRRSLLWDRYTGRVRIEVPGEKTIYLVNVNSGTGKVKKGEDVIAHPDSLSKYLTRGKNIWINDSYWLVMPFKLKDSGVTIRYQGQDSIYRDVLQLTFEAVGATPDNKYLVYVDPSSRLVVQWDYFAKAGDPKPSMSTPWLDYQRFGKILLSPNRSGQRMLKDIGVFSEVPDSAFESWEPVDYSKLGN